MTAQYIRDYYQVPAKRGMRVTVDGRDGVITGFHGQYILVRFRGGHGSLVSTTCHPTWRVTYHTPDGDKSFGVDSHGTSPGNADCRAQ